MGRKCLGICKKCNSPDSSNEFEMDFWWMRWNTSPNLYDWWFSIDADITDWLMPILNIQSDHWTAKANKSISRKIDATYLTCLANLAQCPSPNWKRLVSGGSEGRAVSRSHVADLRNIFMQCKDINHQSILINYPYIPVIHSLIYHSQSHNSPQAIIC